MISALLSLVTAAVPVADFFPCEAGHTVEYRLSDGSKWTDVVRGPHEERSFECIVDRRIVDADGAARTEAWVFERTKDRVSDAGWAGMVTAFRPPLLVAPLTAKKSWRFNRTTYVVEADDARVTVPAGTFDHCVIVSQRPTKGGAIVARSTYAPRVGLIRVEREGQVREATRVSPAKH